MAGTIELVHSADLTTDTNSYTFASCNFGSAASDRVLVAAINSRGSSSISGASATIGGGSATKVVEQANGSYGYTGLWLAAVPTGASGSVTFAFTGSGLRASLDLFRIAGIDPAPVTTAASDNAFLTMPSASLTVPAGGVALASFQAAGIASVDWSGLTERSERLVESIMRASSASDAFASAQSPLSVSRTCNATPGVPTFVAASFGPSSGGGSIVPLVVHHMRMQGMA